MTEDEAIAALRGIRHQLLAIFRALGGARIYLMNGDDLDDEPVAVIVPAEWHEDAAWALATDSHREAVPGAGLPAVTNPGMSQVVTPLWRSEVRALPRGCAARIPHAATPGHR